jgi:predicted phage terminase large subunit-like protein
VERGEVDRLQLLLPPRHGKSELASRRFPAWYLGRHPDRQFISVSANADLAIDFGRDVRNIISSQEYAQLFDTTLAPDSAAKGKWHTNEGGVYIATGIGGQILGRGAHVMLIDDPFASMKEALSELERKNVYDWYTGTAYNRLMPGGAIVLINHRMHEEDLSGMLLHQQAAGGDKWEVVELPAIDDAGHALWPEAYPLDALERIRLNSQPRFWSALFQQKPTPDEGDYFKQEWLRPYITPPSKETLRIYGASDYAVTSDGGDYTVHVVVGVDTDRRMYLLDVWRKQASADVWIEKLCEMSRTWKPIAWGAELGQINASLKPFIEDRMRRTESYCCIQTFPSKHDKAIRARAIQGRMAIDGLYVPENAPWYSDFRHELLSFPAGKHDDQVDALGLIGQLLLQPCRFQARLSPAVHLAVHPTLPLSSLPTPPTPLAFRGRSCIGRRPCS